MTTAEPEAAPRGRIIKPLPGRICLDLAEERDRQDRKHPAPEGFNWGNALGILVEEVGEVAKEHIERDCQITTADAIANRERLRTELIQTAASAIRWVELIDAEKDANRRTHLAPLVGAS